MPKYETIERFKDSDSGHIYNVGEKYPHKGRAKKERVEALSTSENKVGRPFIREVEEGDS